MECLVCGTFGDGDRQAGYAADPICPACAREGWVLGANGTPVQFAARPRPQFVDDVIESAAYLDTDVECPF